jgi:hypothetical protein
MDENTETKIDQERALRLLESIENDLHTLRQIIGAGHQYATEDPTSLHGFMQLAPSPEDDGIEGAFDGERMIDYSGKSYQVPPNYASKSKLIEGDPLKLYITREGKYLYKQLGPIERRTIPGTLRMEGNHYIVDSDEGDSYSILTACVTYYMSLFSVKAGDRVMIMVPADVPAKWAVIDNVL